MSAILGSVRKVSLCASLTLLLSAVAVAAQATVPTSDVAKVEASPQTVEFDGGTARFSSQLTIGPNGRAVGPMIILILSGTAEEAEDLVLRAEEGRAVVDSGGKVIEIVVVGTVLDADGDPHGRFSAGVTPTADGQRLRYEWDFGNDSASGLVVAEGTMKWLGDADGDSTR